MDNHWMKQALHLAKQAEKEGEVPVGAVLVFNDQLIGAGWNSPISQQDPTAHAEIIALREAATRLSNYRLTGTTLYVTLEPCLMCLGAVLHARVARLVYGADDPKIGAVRHLYLAGQLSGWNHTLTCEGGVLKETCAEILKNFFIAKRNTTR